MWPNSGGGGCLEWTLLNRLHDPGACYGHEVHSRFILSTSSIMSFLLFLNPRYRQGLDHLGKSGRVSVLAIDEAHCVSEWWVGIDTDYTCISWPHIALLDCRGHDFRENFLRLGELRSYLPRVPLLAVTATATPRVQAEIAHHLRLMNPRRYLCMDVLSVCVNGRMRMCAPSN